MVMRHLAPSLIHPLSPILPRFSNSREGNSYNSSDMKIDGGDDGVFLIALVIAAVYS